MKIIELKSSDYYLSKDESGVYDDLQQKLNHAREFYNNSIELMNKEYQTRKEEFTKARNEARKNLKFEYSVNNTTNEKGKHYEITRKTINPIEGDSEFCKDVKYCTFKFVNNVMIRTGSGHIIGYSGLILSDDEINQLENNIVPEVLLTTKAEF